MKSNDIKAAMAAFLSNNPDLPEGTTDAAEADEVAEPAKVPVVHVCISKKGRAGKTATIIDGLGTMTPADIDLLSKNLKKHLGVGGSWRDDEILIQGNLVDAVKKYLIEKGFKLK